MKSALYVISEAGKLTIFRIVGSKVKQILGEFCCTDSLIPNKQITAKYIERSQSVIIIWNRFLRKHLILDFIAANH